MTGNLYVEVRVYAEPYPIDPDAPLPQVCAERRVFPVDLPRQYVQLELDQMTRRVLAVHDEHDTEEH